MDIGQGAGLAGATRRAAVPSAAARGRAGARRHGHRLRRHRLVLPRVARLPGARCWRWPWPRSRWTARRAGRPSGRVAGLELGARRARAGARRARCSRARWPTAATTRWPGLVGGRCCARCSASSPWRRAAPRAPARSTAAPRRLARRLRRHGGAGARRRSRCLIPPLSFLALVGFAVLLVRGRRARGTRSTRACASCVTVAGAEEARPGGHRLAQAGRCSTARSRRAARRRSRRSCERGTYVRDCVSTFPSVTPVASAAIATGAGPGEHHIPSMNWYHRGEERYVEYGSSFQATRAFGVRPLALRHGLQHEHGPPQPGRARPSSSTSTTPGCAPPAPPT